MNAFSSCEVVTVSFLEYFYCEICFNRWDVHIDRIRYHVVLDQSPVAPYYVEPYQKQLEPYQNPVIVYHGDPHQDPIGEEAEHRVDADHGQLQNPLFG